MRPTPTPEDDVLTGENQSPIDRRGLVASLAIVVILLVQSSWFFATVCIMAVGMVLAGSAGQWRDWIHWVAIIVGFTAFAGLRAAMGPWVEEDPLFMYAIQLETLGGLLPVSNAWLQEHVQSGILDALTIFVYLTFFFIPQMTVVYLWKTGGPFRRYVLAGLGLFVSALVVHVLLPTAPPWMASEAGLIPPLDRIIIRVLTSISPSLTAAGYAASANDVAAMPSVHQGLTVLATIALVAHRPRFRWAGWVYGLGMLFAIAYLGEHYVVDGVAGGTMAWLSWWAAGRFFEPAERSDAVPSGYASVPEGDPGSG